MKPQFQPDEPFISFVSRSARFLGLSGVGDLVRDVGVPLGAFLKGNRDAITRVAKVLGVDPEAAVFRSFRRIDAQNTQVLNLTLRENRLLRGKSRVCPACLRSDTGTAAEIATRRAVSILSVIASRIFSVAPITLSKSGQVGGFALSLNPEVASTTRQNSLPGVGP